MNTHSFKVLSAHEIASTNYVDWIFSFTSKSKFFWECMGYSRTGNSVSFARIEVLENNKLKQINKYVNPDKQIYVWKHE